VTSIAYAALWIFVFAVPWDRLVTLPGVNIVSKLTGGLALGLTIFAVLFTGRVRRWRLFQIAGFLFVVWTGVGVWIMLQGRNIPLKFFTFVQLFLVVWMIWELAPSSRRLRGLMIAYVCGSAVPAIATILLYARAGGTLRRFSAGGADANSLAMTLALALPMAWYLALTTQKPLARWAYRAFLPLGLLASALTGSRGGMIAWIVALSIIPLTMVLTPGRLAAAIGLLGLSAALVIVYVPDQVAQRLGSTGTQVETVNFGGRFRLWLAGVHAFTRKPMMGYGVGMFRAAIEPEVGPDPNVAHNSYLSVLVEEGLVGLALYSTMILSVLFSILRLRGLERRFALVLMATLTTAMLPLTWEDQKQVWFVTALLIGISTPLVIRQRIALQRAEPDRAPRAPRVAARSLQPRTLGRP
jgi:O-antigen ligase